MKKLLVDLWNRLVDIKNDAVECCLAIKDFFYQIFHKPPRVATVSETIDKIVNDRCSVSRFGDGEIKLVAGSSISFQNATPFVTEKLREVLSSDCPGHLVAIADVFGDKGIYVDSARKYWTKHLRRFRKHWYRYLIDGKTYYNAMMTRNHLEKSDHSNSEEWFLSLKRIWDGADVVFIEGEKSRLGVGNDLFDNAKSIRRILGPSKNAFSKYDELLSEAKKLDKQTLFLLALGPCATALAYDLHRCGFRAVDVGHVDIEYEWFTNKVTEKSPVKGKYVNEAGGLIEDKSIANDAVYLSEIIARHV